MKIRLLVSVFYLLLLVLSRSHNLNEDRILNQNDEFKNDEGSNKMIKCTNYIDTNKIMFSFNQLQQGISISFSIFIFLTSILAIRVFINFRDSRKEPQFTILCIQIGNFLLSIHWLSFGLYYSIDGEKSPNDNAGFCQTMGVIGLFADSLVITYSFLFTLVIFLWIFKEF